MDYTTCLTGMQEAYANEVTLISKEIVDRIRVGKIKNRSTFLCGIEELVNDSEWTLISSKIRAAIFCSNNWDGMCKQNIPIIISGQKKHEGSNYIVMVPDFLPLEQIAFNALMLDVKNQLDDMGVSFEDEEENDEQAELTNDLPT